MHDCQARPDINGNDVLLIASVYSLGPCARCKSLDYFRPLYDGLDECFAYAALHCACATTFLSLRKSGYTGVCYDAPLDEYTAVLRRLLRDCMICGASILPWLRDTGPSKNGLEVSALAAVSFSLRSRTSRLLEFSLRSGIACLRRLVASLD